MNSYRRKKLLTSRLKRSLRWEFWPMWAFYPPVLFGILLLAIRYGGLRQLTAVNPSMPAGGLIDADKAKNLFEIQNSLPDAVAKTALIELDSSNAEAELDQKMRELDLQFPIILKPNSGQRGLGVQVIRDQKQAEAYFAERGVSTLIQEYVEGEEFGVFYMREPNEKNGFIFSITHKKFPTLTGDGESTLERLILADLRSHYMAEFFLEMHADRIHSVLPKGKQLKLVEIGSHCRGSLFLDATTHITPALTDKIDEISQSIENYYFGRYDLRVPTLKHLKRGEQIKVIEANGLTSESTNIYDPKHSLMYAYRTLHKQWQMAFRISKQNRLRGVEPSSWDEIIAAFRGMNRG